MTTGILIYINKTHESVATDILPFEGGLSEMQAAVGGYIEAVPTDDNVTIWVNEDGKNTGLPRNKAAEVVWRLFDYYGCVASGDWVAGSVVITGPSDSKGELTDLSPAAATLVRTALGMPDA